MTIGNSNINDNDNNEQWNDVMKSNSQWWPMTRW